MSHVAAYRREYVIPGNSFQRQYICKAGGVVVDLTGYEVRWTAYYGDQKIEKTTTDDSLLMTDPASGMVELNLIADETRLVPINDNMRYQLEIISGAGIETTILYGDLVGIVGGYNLDG